MPEERREPLSKTWSYPNDTRTTVMVALVIRMKPCPELSPNQLAKKIACGTETTLIRNEDTTPSKRYPVIVCAPYSTLSGAADGQLSKGCSVQDGG
ncbi:hypothetical protein TNCV_1962171 [Trichonephila clavipes]|nr:hypothetical protein TNCV_1962171 [Trichonephila clavipes]